MTSQARNARGSAPGSVTVRNITDQRTVRSSGDTSCTAATMNPAKPTACAEECSHWGAVACYACPP